MNELQHNWRTSVWTKSSGKVSGKAQL